MSKVEQHDLVKYGLMPELIGRLPIITALNPLSEEDLVHILTEPKNAITKQYQELLSIEGVELEFEDAALRKIAELAIQKKTGARGLRSIIESAMRACSISIAAPYVKRLTTSAVTRNAGLKYPMKTPLAASRTNFRPLSLIKWYNVKQSRNSRTNSREMNDITFSSYSYLDRKSVV